MTICKPEGRSGGIINVYHHQGQGGGVFVLQSIDWKLEGREVSGCDPAFFIGRRLRVARRTPAGEEES